MLNDGTTTASSDCGSCRTTTGASVIAATSANAFGLRTITMKRSPMRLR